jgi:hypothetical protein
VCCTGGEEGTPQASASGASTQGVLGLQVGHDGIFAVVLPLTEVEVSDLAQPEHAEASPHVEAAADSEAIAGSVQETEVSDAG